MYTKLNELKNEDELEQFKTEIRDRFGEVPTQVNDLFLSVRLKWIAANLGLEKLILKNQKMVGYFIQDQQSSFYQSAVFGKIIQYVQMNPGICQMKEKKTRNGLRLIGTFEGINSVEDAVDALKTILKE